MRRLLAVGIVVLLVAGSCLALVACRSDARTDPKTSLSTDLASIKNTDSAALELLSEQLSVGDQFGIDSKDLAKAWLSGFTYSTDSFEEYGTSATAKVTVTSRSLQSAMDKSMPAIGQVMANPSDDENIEALYARCGQILLENLKAEPLATTSLVLTYHLVDGKWVMDTQSERELASVLYSG